MKLKIEYINKKDLIPYANNAKIHSPEQIEQISESIRLFGFNDPIAIWGENEVVEGHGRLLAVIGMVDVDTVPVIRLDGLTDNQRRAYALIHNKLAISTGFDLVALQSELDSIEFVDMEEFDFISREQVTRDVDEFFYVEDEVDEPKEKSRLRFIIKGEGLDYLSGWLEENGYEYKRT